MTRNDGSSSGVELHTMVELVEGRDKQQWYGQCVQLANATTAEFLRSHQTSLLKCAAAVPPVMKLCLFVAFAGFTFCQILSVADPVKKEPARHIRAVTGGRQLPGVLIRRTSTKGRNSVKVQWTVMAEKLVLPHPFQLFVCHCGKEVLKKNCGEILSGLASSQTHIVGMVTSSNGGGSDHLELINCTRAGSDLWKGQAKKFFICLTLAFAKSTAL